QNGPAGPLCRQQHRERRVLFRLDGLDGVHNDAEHPPGLTHSCSSLLAVVRSLGKARNATITRFSRALWPLVRPLRRLAVPSIAPSERCGAVDGRHGANMLKGALSPGVTLSTRARGNAEWSTAGRP